MKKVKRKKKEIEINIVPKEKGESQAEYAYRLLRMNIMECRLPPGGRIIEEELAGGLDISRTPVHEAVNRLKEEALVHIIPRKASRVSKIKISYINEGIILRCAVEPKLAELAARKLDPGIGSRMEKNLRQQEAVVGSGGGTGMFLPLDDAFHLLVYEATGMARLCGAVRRVANHLDRLRYLCACLWEEETMREAYSEHRALYGYLLSGDDSGLDLGQLFKKHIMRPQEKMEEVMGRYPEYFEY